MTLHVAIEKLLREIGRPMSTQAIANELNLRKWYQKGDGSPITAFQIHGRTRNYPNLFVRSGSLVSLIGNGKEAHSPSSAKVSVQKASASSGKNVKDEDYVLDLCNSILNRLASRQHRFDFLVGDVNAKGLSVKLPVDAYFEDLKLVVEYRERQHTEVVTFFDKPNRTTVSGVHRGEQRKIYDERRRLVLPKNGIALIDISYTDFKHDTQKRIVRNYPHDVEVVRKILKDYLER